jgi:glycosyltransferase involved in cell wall biosynthesis
MKLSILIICFNQEKYINQCVDSIIMQRIPFEYEVIVADDYSNDGTISIIKDKLLGKVSNLRFLDNSKNIGISKNYKRSFAECKGEYIAVMEGDDYWTNPNRLHKHLNFLDDHRECVMSMNRYIEHDENSNVFSHGGWDFPEDYRYVTTQEMATGNKLGNLSACVFRKTEIDQIKTDLYDLEIADWMLGMVLSQNGYISILKELMSVRRVHDDGEWSKMSVKKRNENLLNCIDSYNKYLAFKYDKEFSVYKRRLNESNSLKQINSIDFIPPIFIYVFKLLFPKIIIEYIRKLFKD